ncbi:MAG: hypothetical protein V4543_14375 [Bacteroidota bacterium]
MTLPEWLISKNINIDALGQNEPAILKEWETLFPQMHPDAFTAQKKFMINPLRRKYPVQVYISDIKSGKPAAD